MLSVQALQTVQALEWDRLLVLVAGHAHSTAGAERCRTLSLAVDLEAARRQLAQTVEMLGCGERGLPCPSIASPDVRPQTDRARKGAVLDGPELRDILRALHTAEEVHRYIRRTDGIPELAALADPLAAHADRRMLIAELERAIDDEGHIRDNATPELRRLISHAQDLKQTMRRRLETILASTRYAEVLQERYFAERQGRYVIPVKAEQQSRIPGIVHDLSSTGATVFLEPRELVELNNAIKVADLDVEREVRRILQQLSTRVAQHADQLAHAVEVLAELDAVDAKAAFSRRIGGQPVGLNDRGRIVLRQARHPLLMLSREYVVANDVILDGQTRVLVISGPNTGGKTVTLKLVGLAALMVRAGLLPACAEGSEMAFFSDVFADVGDAQDLARDLSSFSAHIVRLVELLKRTHGAAVGRSSLVLLDELATSTDPDEGAALAEALLRHLAERGMTVLVTTHYQALKALGQTTPGFVNASVGFDVATLAPTYRLTLGVPGGSAALDIAGRLGLDPSILERAGAALDREGRAREAHRIERMLTDIQKAQQQADADRAAAAALRADAERAARDTAAAEERLRAVERDARKDVRRKLNEDLMRARAEVQAVLDELKRERTVAQAREMKARLADIASANRAVLGEHAASLPLERLRAGDAVEIAGLGAIGIVLEAPAGKKRVRVRVGETEMRVAVDRLVGRERGEASNAAARPARSASRSAHSDADPIDVVDVRGQLADEALDRTVSALDHATLAGQGVLRIIHGHGTGRLKAAIREYLRESPYVSAFRPGQRDEGGDGVTIVELKR